MKTGYGYWLFSLYHPKLPREWQIITMEGLVGVRSWDFEVRKGSTILYRFRQMQLICEFMTAWAVHCRNKQQQSSSLTFYEDPKGE
jgi:hypothetical protein